MRALRIALASAVLAGCAATPKPVADNTPQHPTAVFETQVSSTGIAGMFPFETTEKHYVRSNMRREEHAGKGTGAFSGFLMTRLMGHGNATIERLDRKVRWTVDDEKREYTECPLHGCPPPPQKEKPAQAEPQREEPKQQTEKGCVMHIASSHFEVKPTGQKDTVNGFPAEQYKMAWVVRMQDRERRTTTSTVNVDLWTTPLTPRMREALAMESAFDRTFVASAPYPRAARAHMAKEEPPVMPPQVLAMMTGYLSSLNAHDRASLHRAAAELNKVKGHPIRTKLDWLLDGNACGAKEEEHQAAQPATAQIVSGITGLFGSKKEEKAGPAPLVSFTVDVKQLGVEPMHDGVFAVPAGYKLVKTE